MSYPPSTGPNSPRRPWPTSGTPCARPTTRTCRPDCGRRWPPRTGAPPSSPAPGTRLTCDVGLVCRDGQHEVRDTGTHVLVESKSSAGGGAADRILRDLGVRPASVSKYCVGVAALHPELPSNPWHQTLRRYFGPRAIADPAPRREKEDLPCDGGPRTDDLRSSRWPRDRAGGLWRRHPPTRNAPADDVATSAGRRRPRPSRPARRAPWSWSSGTAEKPDGSSPGIDAQGKPGRQLVDRGRLGAGRPPGRPVRPGSGSSSGRGWPAPKAIYAAGANDDGEGQRHPGDRRAAGRLGSASP